MLDIYFDGRKVASLAVSEDLLAQIASGPQGVEIRIDSGKTTSSFVPGKPPIIPWEPEVTREEIDRRIKAPGGMKLADFWKKMGVE